MGGLEWDEASRGSFGGTEVMARELERRLPGELLERFQIVTSQVKTLAPDKIRVFWCHCTPYARPAAYLANGGWRNFHRIVFVSNWQAQAFISKFGIPWSRCQVMLNSCPQSRPGHPARCLRADLRTRHRRRTGCLLVLEALRLAQRRALRGTARRAAAQPQSQVSRCRPQPASPGGAGQVPCIRLPGVGRGNQLPVPHGSNVSRAGLRPSEQRRAV